jgi:hypothetical protein
MSETARTEIALPDFTTALLSDAPTPQYAERLRRFGQLVGTWEVRGSRLNEETGEWADRLFTWVVSFVLDGRALQDVELIPDADDPDVLRPTATALRVYDPVAGATRVSYFSPITNQYANLVAVGYRDGIRQDGSQNDGRPIRWNFSSLTGDSYLWDAWVSNDEGATWVLVEHLEGARIDG